MHPYLSKEHEQRFKELCNRDRTHIRDIERRSLFYVIAGSNMLFNNVELLYDFKDSVIKLEVYDQPFLTGGTRCLIDLAFHLYGADVECDICFMFNQLDHIHRILALNTIKYRFQIIKELEVRVS
ncbi:DUF6075 family protein [Paenibacillus tyrfis]|uniref:DUF6075 family protein n=1 Tax=Paenibacillus tyrfis TaxID=1501230 RepID=UPI00068F5B7C|nr:DUF6075 family protein [Paenibacillus tyrfis]